MKFKVTFKTPDVVDDAIDQMGQDLLERGCSREDIEGDLWEADKTLQKFIRYNEIVEIEFDTEQRTATVVVQNEHP